MKKPGNNATLALLTIPSFALFFLSFLGYVSDIPYNEIYHETMLRLPFLVLVTAPIGIFYSRKTNSSLSMGACKAFDVLGIIIAIPQCFVLFLALFDALPYPR